MSSRGRTWGKRKGKKEVWKSQKPYQKARSWREQRNRRKDDQFQVTMGVSGMSYEEFQVHVRNCRRKVAHKSLGAAYRAKKEYEAKYGVEYWTYQCPVCNRFHLTTHPWGKEDK